MRSDARVRRFRYGLRGLLLAVAVAAVASLVLCVWLPRYARWRRIDAILDAPRGTERMLDARDNFRLMRGAEDLELALLRSMPGSTLDRIEHRAVGGGPTADPEVIRRRLQAVDKLGGWLDEVDSADLAREAFDRLLTRALKGDLPPRVEAHLVVTLSGFVPRLEVGPAERARVRDRLRAVATGPAHSSVVVAAWAGLAAEVGGREEIAALADLIDRRVPWALAIVRQPTFRQCRWPGLVPTIVRALDDRTLAPEALRCPILLAHPDGRAALLARAADPARPRWLRAEAIRRLGRDRAGLVALIDACADPARRATIGGLLAAGSLDDPRPDLLARLDEYEANCDPWEPLVRGLDVARNAVDLLGSGLSTAEQSRLAQGQAARSGLLLAAIVPPPRPKNRAEWDEWLRAAPPGPIPWPDYLAALERYPDDGPLPFDASAVTISPDSLPILVRMAHSQPDAYRHGALKELVLRTDRTDEVAPLLDALAVEAARDPSRLSGRDSEIIRTLRRRFAVNFFWDDSAWRAWWATESAGGR